MSNASVVSAWRCLAQAERQAVDLFAVSSLTPPFFVAEASLDAVFQLYSLWSPLKRRQTFTEQYNLTRVLVGNPPNQVAGYFANQQWCLLVFTCRAAGGCQLSDPICLQLAFYNSPSP